ncbi:MAG TPA: DUF3987 domain-containing protein [Phycisphaerales bacterium]|nr:DUF3987 domain-containing protein [Phycisphaerales bacterium]
MSDGPSNLLGAARWYLARGYAPIPVPAGTKVPVLKGWTDLRLADADLPQHFNGTGNIGVLLGEPSGWLVDVDLDCEEAVALAPQFLPPTGATTGRPGKPASHWWYVSEGAKTRKHQDPASKKMIVELRSTGAQTVVGPSVHPSGEPYDPLEGDPAVVDAETLGAAVAALAEAVRKQRHGDTPARQAAKPAASRCLPASDGVLRRAEAYLDHIPPAISGSGGHSQTYAAATAMVHGFGLDPETAFGLLWDRYNPRCDPPWSEKELRHKVNDAASKPHERPHGWLRDAGPVEPSDVDLSGFMAAPALSTDSSDVDDAPVDPGPLPDHFLSVPGLVSEVMAHNRATAHRWQPMLALAGAICLQAVLAGRKVRDERGNRTNLYVVCLAGSGSGKDNARIINKDVLFKAGLNDLEGQEDLASDAGLVTAVEAQPAVLFQIDEFGRWLRTIGDPKKAPHLFNVISTLMKMYSSARSVFKGKAYADAKRNKVIDQPCVSLLATTAPEHFKHALTPDAMSDGFMARLIVFETGEMPPRVWQPEKDPPQAIVDAAAWWGAFNPGGNLSREHPRPIVVPTTDDARAVFNRLAALADTEMERPREDLRSIWARVEEKACRLALIYACSENREKPVIDADAAEWACGLSEHLTRRVLYLAHEYVSQGEFDAKQKAVLRAMRTAGGRMTRSQMCRVTQHLTQRERDEVIENLKETGRLKEAVEPTAGRSRRVYELLP